MSPRARPTGRGTRMALHDSASRKTTALRAPAIVAAMAAAIAIAAPCIARADDPPDAPAKAPVGRLLVDTPALTTWVERQSRELAAARARVAAARADLGQSRVLPNPVVDFSVDDMAIGHRNPPNVPWTQTPAVSVGLSETVEIGKRGPRSEAARLRLEAAKLGTRSTAVEKVSDARQALAEVAYRKARKEVLDASLADAKQGLELERIRMSKGDISGNDLERLELDTISLETDVTRARAEYDSALASCEALLYAPCDPSDATADALDRAAPVPDAPNGVRLEERPDIAAARLEQKASREDAVLARRRAIPDPTFRVGYTHDFLWSYSGSQANTLSASVAVPLPIFDHGQHDAARAEARAAEIAATTDANLVQARADRAALEGRRRSLERSLGVLEHQALPKSTGVLASIGKAFDQGQVSLTDLLLARRNHLQIQLGIIDLRYDTFGVRNELRRVLGLDQDESGKGNENR